MGNASSSDCFSDSIASSSVQPFGLTTASNRALMRRSGFSLNIPKALVAASRTSSSSSLRALTTSGNSVGGLGLAFPNPRTAPARTSLSLLESDAVRYSKTSGGVGWICPNAASISFLVLAYSSFFVVLRILRDEFGSHRPHMDQPLHGHFRT